MRIPLPGRIVCVSAIGIAVWNAILSGNAPNLTKAASAITVSLSPAHGAVTLTQSLPLTAIVGNDPSSSGVSWSSSGGILSKQTAGSAIFAATAAGVYTITATSKADTTRSAVATVGVTDLAGVTTWRNDRAHYGVNSHEYALTRLRM